MASKPGPHPAPPADFAKRELPLRTVKDAVFRIHRKEYGPIFYGCTGNNRFDAGSPARPLSVRADVIHSLRLLRIRSHIETAERPRAERPYGTDARQEGAPQRTKKGPEKVKDKVKKRTTRDGQDATR